GPHPYGQGQGPQPGPGDRGQWAAQRGPAGDHDRRPGGRQPAGRRDPDRAGVLLARRRPPDHRGDHQPGLSAGPGDSLVPGGGVRRGDPDRRPAVRVPRSASEAVLMTTTAAGSTAPAEIVELPPTRHFFLVALRKTLRRNKVAQVAVVILCLVVLVGIFGP